MPDWRLVNALVRYPGPGPDLTFWSYGGQFEVVVVAHCFGEAGERVHLHRIELLAGAQPDRHGAVVGFARPDDDEVWDLALLSAAYASAEGRVSLVDLAADALVGQLLID